MIFTIIKRNNAMNTFDPTKNTTPVGLMDPANLDALKAHGGPYEAWNHQTLWFEQIIPYFDDWKIIRAKPVVLTKPSINWDHVAPRFYKMLDSGVGNVYLWDKNGSTALANSFTSFIPGTCDWKDSLVMRPGYNEGDKS